MARFRYRRGDEGSRNPFPIPLPRKAKAGVGKEGEAEIESAPFRAKAVEPHDTQAGFLFFDVTGLDHPATGARLYVTGVNDAHGHEVGDTVLAQVAQRISAQLRAQDTAARWGGEEFLLLLPETCASGAAVLAHKVREAVGKAGVPVNGRELPLTLTVGLCEYHAGITVGECIKAADQAMYAGKQAGKNQVVVCAAGETPAA